MNFVADSANAYSVDPATGNPVPSANTATWEAVENAAYSVWGSGGLGLEGNNEAVANSDATWGGYLMLGGWTDAEAANYLKNYGAITNTGTGSAQTPEQVKQEIWSAYDSANFWVQSPDKPCAQLFSWSS